MVQIKLKLCSTLPYLRVKIVLMKNQAVNWIIILVRPIYFHYDALMKLFHYVHCPFCVRVRMALGLLNIPYDSIVLPYDDEKTPIDLCQVKMLPIMQFDNGQNMIESLDIIKKLDQTNQLQMDLLDQEDISLHMDNLLNEIGKPVHNLCMPYWIYTKEFDEKSRRYFQEKKEKKRGPFHLLIQNKQEHLKNLAPILVRIQKNLMPFYLKDKLTILDIMLASHLWGLYIFPEFQFPPQIHQYLQRVKSACRFQYHEDFWRD